MRQAFISHSILAFLLAGAMAFAGCHSHQAAAKKSFSTAAEAQPQTVAQAIAWAEKRAHEQELQPMITEVNAQYEQHPLEECYFLLGRDLCHKMVERQGEQKLQGAKKTLPVLKMVMAVSNPTAHAQDAKIMCWMGQAGKYVAYKSMRLKARTDEQMTIYIDYPGTFIPNALCRLQTSVIRDYHRQPTYVVNF